jgi:sigma54-dependent transcription regulator
MTRRTLLFPLATAVLIAAGAYGVRGNWPWTRLSDVPTANAVLVSVPFRVVRDTLQQGETVTELFQRQGITRLDLSALSRVLRFDPRKIKAGLVFSVRRNAADSATHVEFRPNPDEWLRFIRTSNGDWRGESVPVHWSMDTVRVSGEIESNLFDAFDLSVIDLTLDAN